METSLFLARLIGPLFLVVALGLLLNPGFYREMIAGFLSQPALYYFSGTLALLAGLAILLVHNLWVADWRVAITLIGWLSLLKGLVRLLAPRLGLRLAEPFAEARWPLPVSGALLLLLGGWLSALGFGLA